jgi:hypothetical protein
LAVGSILSVVVHLETTSKIVINSWSKLEPLLILV